MLNQGHEAVHAKDAYQAVPAELESVVGQLKHELRLTADDLGKKFTATQQSELDNRLELKKLDLAFEREHMAHTAEIAAADRAGAAEIAWTHGRIEELDKRDEELDKRDVLLDRAIAALSSQVASQVDIANSARQASEGQINKALASHDVELAAKTAVCARREEAALARFAALSETLSANTAAMKAGLAALESKCEAIEKRLVYQLWASLGATGILVLVLFLRHRL